MSEPLDRAAKQQLVDEVGTWHHSIDLGDGVITPGGKTPHHFHDELRRLRLPEMLNKSVLDIGAWDGFYTFHAEHAQASRVVALDHYAWSIDFQKATAYRSRERAGGQTSRAFHTVPEVWDPIGLPGKRGFDLAYRARNSRAEVVVDDFMTMDVETLGTFDARKVRVIELRFFSGLTVEETAEVLDVSADTVARDWRMARTWLMRELDPGSKALP